MVDSVASMHMMSKKELSLEEMSTVKRSRIPTVVLTAGGEVHIDEEAQVFVHDLNPFVTVRLLEETPVVLRSHFGSSHFLLERARWFFPFTSFPGFVLSKCLQPSFAVSQLFSWHV